MVQITVYKNITYTVYNKVLLVDTQRSERNMTVQFRTIANLPTSKETIS